MRQTRELIILIFAVTVGCVVVIGLIGLLTVELAHPKTDTGEWLAVVWNVAALMLGAIVGYLLGRHGNGKA